MEVRFSKKEIINPVVNLAEIELDEEMKQIFSFGMSCHLKTKKIKRRTKIQIEKKYLQADLRDKNKISILHKNRFKYNLQPT